MGKHFASNFLGGCGAILFAVSVWLGVYGIKGLAVAEPNDGLPPMFEFMLSQTKLSTLTLAACILIGASVFIVGAFIVHQLEDRRL